MAIPIPPDFDYKKEMLDAHEVIVRDLFGMQVENWARFRYAIGVGTDPAHLKGPSVSDDLKDSYRELGKCHYEVVLSIGYCNLALTQLNFGSPFVVSKSIKDFYFHGGVLLDNLSRLIYIINVPGSVLANTRKD